MISLLVSLSFVGGHSLARAAETRVDGPGTCYAFTLEISPKDGPAQRILFATAGGKLEVSFNSEPVNVEGNSIPVISGFSADVEPLENGKLWLRQLTLGHTMPYVTGLTQHGSVNTGPDGARTRSIANRGMHSGDEGGTSSDAAKPKDPASQPSPSRTMRSSVIQQANFGIVTSLVLTLGKKITFFDDSQVRFQLTVSKMIE